MELEGRAAPPMANGEVVFDAPWQGRVFGMARALCEAGLYEWDEFRVCLIASIDDWEHSQHEGATYNYYNRFFDALVKLLASKGICIESDLAQKTAEFAARPDGHDHT